MYIYFIGFSLQSVNVNYIPWHGMAIVPGYQNIETMVPKMLEFASGISC